MTNEANVPSEMKEKELNFGNLAEVQLKYSPRKLDGLSDLQDVLDENFEGKLTLKKKN